MRAAPRRLRVLSIVHGPVGCSPVFAEAIRARGHAVEEWSLTRDEPLGRPLEDYGAVLVFGGSMHVDEEDRHPWLRDETLLLRRLLDLEVPLLGVCLGAQLLARAAEAPVYRAAEREIGWFPVELTDDGVEDPVLGVMPARFDAFEWHQYTYDLPDGATELARSASCNQAYRIGEHAWGVQFHPEVTLGQVERWTRSSPGAPPDPRPLLAVTRRRLAPWNELGRALCAAFCTVAELGYAGVCRNGSSVKRARSGSTR